MTKLFYPALTFADLATLNFKKSRPVKALDNLNFTLEKGQTLCILGPNGAGKTTFLKIISTVILPDYGKMLVDGYKVGKDDEKIKSLIGLISSEERTFYWRLSGRQNLELFAALQGLSKADAKTRIDFLLKLFKVDYAQRRFDSYSTGMKRRFALIRAMLNDPPILLLDEPTKSLDYSSSQELSALIKELSDKGKTIILATHDIEDAKNLCELFMILNKGKIRAMGNYQQLRKAIGSERAELTEIYLKLTEND